MLSAASPTFACRYAWATIALVCPTKMRAPRASARGIAASPTAMAVEAARQRQTVEFLLDRLECGAHRVAAPAEERREALPRCARIRSRLPQQIGNGVSEISLARLDPADARERIENVVFQKLRACCDQRGELRLVIDLTQRREDRQEDADVRSDFNALQMQFVGVGRGRAVLALDIGERLLCVRQVGGEHTTRITGAASNGTTTKRTSPPPAASAIAASSSASAPASSPAKVTATVAPLSLRSTVTGASDAIVRRH